MSMTDQARMAEARQLAATLDRMTRNPRRFAPSAPWIIPATMVVVAVFALICLAIKLIMNYINSKNEKSKTFGLSHASSPDIPTTPEDQASMATTASMKTRGSLGINSKRRNPRNRPPPVSLYQIKQKQSPGSSVTKSKSHKTAMKAMSRAAKAEANRGLSSRDISRQPDDNSEENNDDNSPTNISQRSDDTDEIQASVSPSGAMYGMASSRTGADQTDGPAHMAGHSSNQPEVHIVQIRELEDNLQHSQATWSKAESDI